MGSDTIKKYGNPLTDLMRDPTGAVELDAYGLAQASLTYNVDTDSLGTVLAALSVGVDYPTDLGFSMKSYKYHARLSKGSVTSVTVDYMGIQQSSGYTIPQIHGVVNKIGRAHV